MAAIKLSAQNYLEEISFSFAGTIFYTGSEVSPCGDIWLSSNNKGVYTYNGSSWTTYDTQSGLNTNKVNCIYTESCNNIYLGTDSGLTVINNGVVNNYVLQGSLTGSSRYVRSIEKFGSELILATLDGLYTFNNGAFTLYQPTNFPVEAYNDVKSNSGILWASSLNNIYKFNGVNAPEVISIANAGAMGYVLPDPNNGLYLMNTVGNALFYIDSLNNVNDLDYVFQDKCAATIDISWCQNVTRPRWFNNGVLVPSSGKIIHFNTQGILNIYVHNNPFMRTVAVSQPNNLILTKCSAPGTTNDIYIFKTDQYTPQLASSITPGICDLLDLNNISTPILNRGDASWNLTDGGFKAPKTGGKVTVFASAIWLGGVDAGGNLHQAAMTYRQNGSDFWPGPIDSVSGNADSTTAAIYDRVWKINRSEIEAFQLAFQNGDVQGGIFSPSEAIQSWPASAPYFDYNNNGSYNWMDGDFPLIKGDQTIYTVFNDKLAAHSETGGQSLGAEIHLMAYEFYCDSLEGGNDKVLNNTVFYNYRIINRSNTDYNNVHVGYFQDIDLGNWQDDYVGCNPAGNYGYGYNSDAVDEGTMGYGNNPPVQNTIVLNGPVAAASDGIDNDNDGTIDEAGEKNLMNSFLNFNNDGTETGNTEGTDDYFNYLTAAWKDSTHCMFGGSGYGPDGSTSNIPYNFMFPGTVNDPNSSLNGLNWTEQSGGIPGGDRRYIIGCGPFDLDAHQTIEFEVANVFVWDPALAWNSAQYWQNNHDQVMRIRDMYNSQLFPTCNMLTSVAKGAQVKDPVGLFPNPALATVYITGLKADKAYTYRIMDITGKIVVQDKLNKAAIDIATLTSGVYVVQITDNETSQNIKFIKQ